MVDEDEKNTALFDDNVPVWSAEPTTTGRAEKLPVYVRVDEPAEAPALVIELRLRSHEFRVLTAFVPEVFSEAFWIVVFDVPKRETVGA